MSRGTAERLRQQGSVAAASTVAGQLARRFGERLSVSDPGGLTLLFPTPECLANASLAGMPRGRARAIRSLSVAVATGELTFSSEPDGATLSRLTRIPGIGEWTAQYVAMRALREPDAFPADDLVLLRAAGNGRPLTANELENRAEAWRPWRAYAAVHLWRQADEEH